MLRHRQALPFIAVIFMLVAGCPECAGEEGEDAGASDAGRPDSSTADTTGGSDAAGSDAATPPDSSEPTPVCDVTPVVQVSSAGDGWRASGTVSAEDDFRGSCSSDYIGADAVVEFTAPNTASYRFSTEGTSGDFDTVLYVRTSCLEPSSELGCNDDAGGDQSTLVVDLTADQTVYVVVDSYRGLDELPFVLGIEERVPTPPTVDTLTAYYNATANALAFELIGQDPGEDVSHVRLELFNAASAALPIAGEVAPELEIATASFMSLTTSGAEYTIRFSASLPDDAAGVASVHATVIDEAGDESAPTTTQVALPTEVASGASCDPVGAFNLCATGAACETDADSGSSTCAAATAPVITSATAYVNPAVNALGVRVSGTDAEANAVSAEVTLLDLAGEPLTVLNDGGAPAPVGPLLTPLTFQTAGSSFEASATGRIDPAIPLADTRTVRLVVIDANALRSEPLEVAKEWVPLVASGAACDPDEGLNICPSAEYCGTADPAAPVCTPVGTACPVVWGVVDLNAHQEDTTTWRFDGDTTDADNLAGTGSCGGGGPQAVLRFSPTTGGRWRFEISDTDPGADTVLFLRSECAAPQPEFELACNDDIDEVGGDYLSAVEVALLQDEAIYLFVDSFVSPLSSDPGYDGPYSLTAALVVQ